MPIEIREIVIKARVEADEGRAAAGNLSERAKEQLREQWRRELDEFQRSRRRERIPSRLER